MALVMDSIKVLPDGTEQIRWHLLDDNYRLIKPVGRFLRYKYLGGAAIGTLKTYAEKLKAFWEYLELKELQWEYFTVDHLAEFGYWYLTGGVLFDGQLHELKEVIAARSERTANLALTVVVQFYEFHKSIGTIEDKHLRSAKKLYGTKRGGLLAGYMKQAPIEVKAVRYKETEKFPGCLDSDQIRKLIDACHTARDKLMIWLLADTGMRKGALLGLHWSDLDFNKGILKLVRRNNPNGAYLKCKEQELSIADLFGIREFCDIYSTYFDDEYPHDVVKKLGHDMIFVVLHKGSDSHGQPLNPPNLNKLLERLHSQTGINIERIYPHLFRHTYATTNISRGIKKGKDKETVAKAVQRQLGHKSIATTLDIIVYLNVFGSISKWFI